MQALTHCPRCNSPLGPDPGNFCKHCGYALTTATQPIRESKPASLYEFAYGTPGPRPSTTRRAVLMLAGAVVVVVLAVLLTVAAAIKSKQSAHPAQTTATPALVAAAPRLLAPTEPPRTRAWTNTPQATPTSTPQPTSTTTPNPRFPAQQMAHLALGYPVKPSTTLVHTFISEMSQMQQVCQMHQFQVANLLMNTWRRINAQGGSIPLQAISLDLEQEFGTVGPVDCNAVASQFVQTQVAGARAEQTAAVSVRESQTPTATPSNTPIDTAMPVASPVPTSAVYGLSATAVNTSVPPVTDTNTGDSRWAVLGGNLSDFVARYGSPIPDPLANYDYGFGHCPGQPTIPRFTVETQDEPNMADPDFGNFEYNASGSTTQVVVDVGATVCPGEPPDDASLLAAAEPFFPQGATDFLERCVDAYGQVYLTYTSPRYAYNAYFAEQSSTVDCNNSPIPRGAFTFLVERSNLPSDTSWDVAFAR